MEVVTIFTSQSHSVKPEVGGKHFAFPDRPTSWSTDPKVALITSEARCTYSFMLKGSLYFEFHRNQNVPLILKPTRCRTYYLVWNLIYFYFVAPFPLKGHMVFSTGFKEPANLVRLYPETPVTLLGEQRQPAE